MTVSRSCTMHPQSPALTINGAVWRSLMTLLYLQWYLIPRWLLRSIFAVFQVQLLNDLGSWLSRGKYSMIDYFMWDALGVLFCPFWNTALRYGARLPIHTLNYWTVYSVHDASFLTGGVFECDLAHRRSVAVLCMLYKIRCNPLHSLYLALPVPYVPVRVTRGAVIAHRYTYAPPRCRTSQYSRTFIPFSVSLWDDLSDPVFDGEGLAGFNGRANAFLLA